MAQTHKLRKARSLFSTTLSTGIGTGTGDTITPNSVTGLATDTEVTLTFDRIDAAGTATPSKMERITGTISGGNLINYTRAVEGTEQAHSSGAVIEYIWNGDDWNDHVDAHLAIQAQDGNLKSGLQINDTSADHQYILGVSELTADRTITLPLLTGNDDFVFEDHTQTLTNKTLTSPVINTGISGTAKASGAEITTGTEDAKFVTPKAIADASVNKPLQSIIIGATRDSAAANGDISYTGVGFTPTSIIAQSSKPGTLSWSFGFANSGKTSIVTTQYAANTVTTKAGLVAINTDASNYADCIVKSYDADGFTLTWTKTGSPTGTASLYFICYR